MIFLLLSVKCNENKTKQIYIKTEKIDFLINCFFFLCVKSWIHN